MSADLQIHSVHRCSCGNVYIEGLYPDGSAGRWHFGTIPNDVYLHKNWMRQLRTARDAFLGLSSHV